MSINVYVSVCVNYYTHTCLLANTCTDPSRYPGVFDTHSYLHVTRHRDQMLHHTGTSIHSVSQGGWMCFVLMYIYILYKW